MHRITRIASIAATALALFMMSSVTPALAEAKDDFILRNPVGKIEIGSGRPLVWRAATAKSAPRAGDRIRTGDRSKVEIAWGNQKVRLYANSILRLPDDEQKAGVERGHSLIDVFRKNNKPSPFELTAEDVVVVVKGTRFGVDLTKGKAVHVSVFEGEVELNDASDSEAFPISVRPGYVARMGGGLTPMVALHHSADPWSSWQNKVPAAPARREPGPAAAAPSRGRDASRAAARDAIRAVERIPTDHFDLGQAAPLEPVELDSVQDTRNAGNGGNALDLRGAQDIFGGSRGTGSTGSTGGTTAPPVPVGDND